MITIPSPQSPFFVSFPKTHTQKGVFVQSVKSSPERVWRQTAQEELGTQALDTQSYQVSEQFLSQVLF